MAHQRRPSTVEHVTTYYSSDTHFGHRNIIEYSARPYRTVDEMNDALIERWNRLVRAGDTVWFLGDTAMGKLAESLPVVAQLNGRKHLVSGNHDRCWPGNTTRSERARDLYLDAGFETIQLRASTTIAGHHVELHHFPYAGDSHDNDRYTEHRPTDRGAWLLHGHVHERWRQRGRQINVGVDVWDYEPVDEDRIAELIVTGPGDIDRYGNAT